MKSGLIIGLITGLVAEAILLATLAATVGLGPPGWVAGMACAVVTNVALARGLVRSGANEPTPGEWITLLRATLVGGIAALVADALDRPVPVLTLVALAAVALALDTVDGGVARRTHTVTRLGGRFDMEVDAWLILVLSVYVAQGVGAWVLAIGAARYVFVAAGWLLPWMRAAARPRHWNKVVAAIQGIVLTVAAADVLPRVIIKVVLVIAAALLAESFGREILSLWRHRQIERHARQVAQTRSTFLSAAATASAGLLVWLALVAPNQITLFVPGTFVRIPAAGLGIVALALILPRIARRVVAVAFGVVLSLLLLLKILDMGFFVVFDRPFDTLSDWSYFGPGVGVLRDTVGRVAALVVVVGAVLLIAAIMVIVPLAVARLVQAVARHRRGSLRTIAAVGVIWIVCAAAGVHVGSGGPVASTSASSTVYRALHQLHRNIVDRQVFAAQIVDDPLANIPGNCMLAGLRGKDVLLIFVESYGRVAVHGSSFAPGVDAVLKAGTRRLQSAGFYSRSAFLTSPTFGGISWLAHSSMESGLWVDRQQRYNQLLASDRMTLVSAFKRAGWRTVSDVPADTRKWPQGAHFYRFDKLYNAYNVGYRGPKFSYATMPDQYTLAAFHRLELAKTNRPPIMAEIDLVSSHDPWTPLPRLVPWDQLGDGTIFDGMPAQGISPAVAFKDSDTVRALYGRSVEYTLSAIFSYVTTYPDPNLVLIVLGDHQPWEQVSGNHPGHDVPGSIIAHDPAVLARLSGWGWQDGMLPGPGAPVWPMSAFRGRFLTVFSYGCLPANGVRPQPRVAPF
ncbi:MAG: CDP-alcohol phosphatidyltransferase family protein [Steroidobacteraceae bacterium]